ncbi:hypothetical protein ACP70R_008945 [Stipagrostis hirtigluma subsp. patula]
MDPSAMHRPLLVVPDYRGEGPTMYNVRIHDSDEPTTMELRTFPRPFVCGAALRNYSVFAVSGSTILGLAYVRRHTVVHDTVAQAAAPGPWLHGSKNLPVMLPVGDDTVVVMDAILPRRGGASSCSFEALRRLPGGEWDAFHLPQLLVGDVNFPKAARISAYFAVGARVWISVAGKGTFTLDMGRGAWQMEGSWELPLRGRAMFVPELGAVIGLNHNADSLNDRRCLCALDVEARPPVLRRVWEETYPGRACRPAIHHGWMGSPWRTSAMADFASAGRSPRSSPPKASRDTRRVTASPSWWWM